MNPATINPLGAGRRVRDTNRGGAGMTKPHKCPVCKATGKYDGKKCHGCDGRGFVWEPQPEQVIVPMPYPVQPLVPIDPYPWPPYYRPWWGIDTVPVAPAITSIDINCETRQVDGLSWSNREGTE